MLLKPGDPFDRYDIQGLLGEGGMGSVYRAFDTKLRRSVALKLLRADKFLDPGERERGRERLLREARAAAALTHVNAIAIHDVGEVGDTSFIAMELVEGRSLRAYVGDATIPLKTRLHWLIDVARALGAAHARGLVHRDVKPENVMIRDDGTVKVLDFGIASVMSAEASPPLVAGGAASARAPISRDSRVAGTLRYMAPEQLEGRPLDGRTDQFAWAVTAHELLAGRLPWSEGGETYSLVLEILSEPPRPLGDDVAELGVELAAVVLRAMSKAPGDRFASMELLVEALEAQVEAPPKQVAIVATSPDGARVVRSRRLRVGAAIGFAAAVAALLAISPLRPRAPRVDLGVTAPPSATAITDLPIPESKVPEARAAYMAALNAIREASHDAAARNLERATELDPTMAAAHLRIPIHVRGMSEVDWQTHFQKARELRALLTPLDRELLVAFEPSFVTNPRDEAETKRRLASLAARNPLDAEIRYLTAAREEDVDQEMAGLGTALALDPKFALAAWRKASDVLLSGDLPGGRSGLLACLGIAPASTSCLGDQALVFDHDGRCADLEANARSLLLTDPSFRTYEYLARALAAQGQPETAVREALAQKWAASGSADRQARTFTDEARLAILRGDFEAAEKQERAMEQLVATSALEMDHADAAWPLVDLYQEMGRDDLAAEIADRFLAARSGWRSLGRWSPRPLMYAAAVRGGRRSEAERARDLELWKKDWEKGWARFHPQWWILGWAIPLSTEVEARAALSAAPSPLPIPALYPTRRVGIGAVGKVLLLAGRTQEALPLLREAALSCSGLTSPIEHTRAHHLLGQALELTGDEARACEAYRVVIDRWGRAPRSVTAEKARARSAALGCASR